MLSLRHVVQYYFAVTLWSILELVKPYFFMSYRDDFRIFGLALGEIYGDDGFNESGFSSTTGLVSSRSKLSEDQES